jgi:hypothetical protein
MDVSPSTHSFHYSKSSSSYMFRLHKAAIILTHVSEKVKTQIILHSYSCVAAVGFSVIKVV